MKGCFVDASHKIYIKVGSIRKLMLGLPIKISITAGLVCGPWIEFCNYDDDHFVTLV
jgi:hypothetical protein